MNEAALTPRARHQLKIVADAGVTLRTGMRILDLGCGEGNTVRALRDAGFDALGCDVTLYPTPKARELIDAGLIKAIPMDPYGLPFGDAEFDLILSSEVLEHVMNYDSFVAESHRVLRPEGLSLHIFPGRWTPVEMHTYVPLASVYRNYPWLRLWSTLGIRNEYQAGKAAGEVAQLNFDYLRRHTNYPTTTQIRRLFLGKFAVVKFREDLFLKHAVSTKARRLNRLVSLLPFLIPVYRTLWNRVMLATK